uniref:S-norcoclaurine synthase n=1 Tax=Anthurium amnicola TaxID=1678845 RepID=A0A1D1YHL7_9ARAE
MKGTVSHEQAVPAAVAEVWAIYGSLRLIRLAVELVPSVFEKVEVVEGDGGEGTVLRVTLSNAFPEPRTYKEKYVKMDHENFIKEAEVVEGGYLNLGFRQCLYRFKMIENGADSCVIRSSIDYDVKEGHEQNVALVTTGPVAALAEAIGNYLTERKPS